MECPSLFALRKSYKELSNHEILEYLELDDLRRLMERLAYWIHTQGGTGDKEGGTLIDRDELIDQLSQYIREMKKVERHQARAEAERFLDQIVRDRAGLLSKQGRDRYAFVHKTFQECLATQEIRDRQEEGFEVVLEHIREHLHDPHWQEVLLLLIAQQKRSNPARVLEEVLKQPTLYERWLHRNLLFAGSCLAENVTVTDAALVKDILRRLVELEASKSRLIPDLIRDRVFKILCSLGETQYEAQALQQLEAVAESIDKVRLSQYKAALGKPEAAVQELILLLKSDVSSDAARALGELGNASQAVIDALLLLLKDEDSSLRSSAAFALRLSGNTSQAVIDALLPLLKDEDSSLRSSAAFALRLSGNTSQAVIDALLPLLKDEGFLVCSSAASTLGELGNASQAVIDALLLLLKNEDLLRRSSAARALGQLGNTSQAVIDALLPLLKDEDSDVRSGVASALGESGNASQAVIDALLPKIKDEVFNVRYAASRALGQLGNTSQAVIDALLLLLMDEDSDDRYLTAYALAQSGNASQAVIDALLPALKYRYLCSEAASALGQSGNASQAVIDALLPLLKDENYFVLSKVARALAQLGNASGLTAIPNYTTIALDQWIEQNQEFEDVANGVEALWNIMSGDR